MKESNSKTIYRYELTVPESAVDMNGHVNNHGATFLTKYRYLTV